MNNKKSDQVVYGQLDTVDILAVGPHPDDIEIGAGAALVKWIMSGIRVGLIDLTQGELGTLGNAELRLAESAEAARRMGAMFRVNMGFPDGAVEDSPVNRQALVRMIRAACPRVVLSNNPEYRHPDHAAAPQLVRSSYFLSRLPRYLPEVPAHSPSKLYHYLIHEQIQPSFLVNVSCCLNQKIHVLEAYQSQFEPTDLPEGYRYTGVPHHYENLRILAQAWGIQGGVAAAEAFLNHTPLVVEELPE